MITLMRRLARLTLDFIDRRLHPRRNRAALARVRRRPPRNILFICHGNICRSPFAERVAAAMLKDDSGIKVSSAGIIGPGRASPDEAIAAAKAMGVDLSAHRSRMIMHDAAAAADLIIVMDARQQEHIRGFFARRPQDVLLLGDFDPRPDAGRVIIDPLDKPRAVFDATYARIKRSVEALIAAASQPDH